MPRSALCWWGALTAVILAVIEGPQRGWLSPLVLGAALIGVLLLVAFGRSEARSDGPLIDSVTRHDVRLRWGAATMSALFFAVFGVQFVITQWIQGPLGESALVAGLFFVPTAVASLLSALCNPRWVRAYGHGRVAAGDSARPRVGALLATGAVVAGSLLAVAIAGLFIGAGIGAASASGAELIMSSAPPERAGSAAGVNETLVEAAGSVGIAVLGSVLVETGSFGWPLPVAAGVAAFVRVRCGARAQPAARERGEAAEPADRRHRDVVALGKLPQGAGPHRTFEVHVEMRFRQSREVVARGPVVGPVLRHGLASSRRRPADFRSARTVRRRACAKLGGI